MRGGKGAELLRGTCLALGWWWGHWPRPGDQFSDGFRDQPHHDPFPPQTSRPEEVTTSALSPPAPRGPADTRPPGECSLTHTHIRTSTETGAHMLTRTYEHTCVHGHTPCAPGCRGRTGKGKARFPGGVVSELLQRVRAAGQAPHCREPAGRAFPRRASTPGRPRLSGAPSGRAPARSPAPCPRLAGSAAPQPRRGEARGGAGRASPEGQAPGSFPADCGSACGPLDARVELSAPETTPHSLPCPQLRKEGAGWWRPGPCLPRTLPGCLGYF